MGILDRYIAAAWLRLFGMCMGSFLSIYLVLDMMERIPRYLRAGGALADIGRFFVFKLPEMVDNSAPFSVLLATLLTLGLFSRNSEIIAMRSCGFSLWRISLPMLLLGLTTSLLLLVNSELILPRSSERAAQVERVDIKKQEPAAVFRRSNIWFRSDDMILQARFFDPASRTLKGVVLWHLDRSMAPISRTDAENALFRDGRWELQRPTVKEFGSGSRFTERSLPSMQVDLRLKIDDLRVLDKYADDMSYAKLKEYAENLQRGGYKAFRYLTMMHGKLSQPFSAFVMVVLGIPFALRSSRSGGLALGIGASVAIGFGYFVINAVLVSYGRNGTLPPVVAAWGANLLFVSTGAWLAMTSKN